MWPQHGHGEDIGGLDVYYNNNVNVNSIDITCTLLAVIERNNDLGINCCCANAVSVI